MNGDPGLKPIPLYPLESDYERNMHEEMWEAERTYRAMNDSKPDYVVWEENQIHGEDCID